ncbi:uncharacterized protein L969DRAFT_17891 [Mixia osmundae IAM 14324]|uniref:Monopolin complex subunit Csm1/Pcs1 C-terminal domain-containing protein n=1 Tax=Mixia osmundae (strain CBS 9802 / IAM 14324 / JCM 22182 / KY 12970) TaxID=764103 RepID=G7E140_MIXOS|nr:uncharacterized protein L969DRAFT_17891 [Mixia osmundae IAM 14324]KEI38809.1 hypothetical protein L969DRAFT_17891 [Mixia osmundae IAM 14324]GAA96550.1 hypothetical protein E5Q_03219 [Mixia osmundae IAM 14324]
MSTKENRGNHSSGQAILKRGKSTHAHAAASIKSASRKRIANSDDESEEDMQSSQASKSKRHALQESNGHLSSSSASRKRDNHGKDAMALYEELRATRTTDVEASLAELIRLSDERAETATATLKQYKQDLDALQAENDALRAKVAARPIDDVPLGTNDKQLADKLESVTRSHQAAIAHVTELRTKLETLEQQADGVRAEERERVQVEHQHLTATVSRLEREIQAETAHSKSVQQKLSALQANASAGTLAQHAPSQASQDELDELRHRSALSEGLTGLLVTSCKEEPLGRSYTCLVMRKRSLEFKLQYNPDNTVSYTPVEPERDDVSTLPAQFSGFMRFKVAQLPAFYKKLCVALD